MSGSARTTILGLVLAAILVFAVSATQAAPPSGGCITVATTTTCTFNYTGAPEAWTVPAGVTSASFDVFGAQGGDGGKGGEVKATLPVTPGDTLQIVVGGMGAASGCNHAGGFNGGGNGPTGGLCEFGGGGGGASDVRQGGTALANRVLVAGGGGGVGQPAESLGGNGGAGGDSGSPGSTGDPGTGSATGGVGGHAGAPAGDSAGGAGGTGGNVANGGTGGDGSLGQGGAGGAGCCFAGDGGGGGGGYNGGGGGGQGASNTSAGKSAGGGGGGGGSNFTSLAATNVTVTNGVQSGNGLITVTYTLSTAQLVSNLKDTVSGMGLPKGLTTALNAKLNAALKALEADDHAGACTALQDFQKLVNAQTGKKLSAGQAEDLTDAARQIFEQICFT